MWIWYKLSVQRLSLCFPLEHWIVSAPSSVSSSNVVAPPPTADVLQVNTISTILQIWHVILSINISSFYVTVGNLALHDNASCKLTWCYIMSTYNFTHCCTMWCEVSPLQVFTCFFSQITLHCYIMWLDTHIFLFISNIQWIRHSSLIVIIVMISTYCINYVNMFIHS